MDSPLPKVFGIGLSRTGTTSLTEALRVLGYRAVHFPLAIAREDEGCLTLDAREAARFDALTDTPVALFFRELDAAFPGSKFILTTRSVDAWLASMRRLRASYAFMRFVPKVARLTEALYGKTAYADEAALRQYFERHRTQVETYFGDRMGRDVLVLDFESGAGWPEVCTFLERAVPSTPFPHANKSYGTTLRNMLDFAGYR